MVALAGLCPFQWLLPGALPCTPTRAHDPPPPLTPLTFPACKELKNRWLHPAEEGEIRAGRLKAGLNPWVLCQVGGTHGGLVVQTISTAPGGCGESSVHGSEHSKSPLNCCCRKMWLIQHVGPSRAPTAGSGTTAQGILSTSISVISLVLRCTPGKRKKKLFFN